MDEAVLLGNKALLMHFQQDFQEIREALEEMELDEAESPDNARIRDAVVEKADNMITLIDQILAL